MQITCSHKRFNYFEYKKERKKNDTAYETNAVSIQLIFNTILIGIELTQCVVFFH